MNTPPPPRVSSYQRLKEKLARNPSERIEKKDWPQPKNVSELLNHAIKGGARSFLLAYGLRAGVNFCLYLLRVMRKRAPLSNILVASFKNLDSVRFGAMFGSFAFLWKLVNNGMRIYRGKDDRLNGLISGAIAGLSILFEKKDRRVDIAQQLLVRALQAVYNAGKARDIFHFKNGDALLFGLTSAQVLYSYTMQPTTLPPDFYSFMLKAARCPEEGLKLNAKNVRGLPITPEEVLNGIQKLRPTPRALAVASTITPHPIAVPCETLHPWMDSCNAIAVERFTKVFKSMMPVYGTLHFIPMLLFRRKLLRSDPTKMISKTTWATLKSGAFLATFVTLYQYQVCMHRNLLDAGWIRFNHKYLYYIFGFVCSYSSIFLEDKKRRSELALYVLPKAVQSFYQILYQKHMMIKIKHFEVIMSSVAMGIIMSFYQEEADVLSSFVRKLMYQFVQKN
ncbi:uncharacterized protein BX664DRAFT_334285 [Halteromyces radiatus]|uniref:uncharacterized protein n=1 Tax=Halteromyces radiatus TaxID=101107 RepID=UPI00221E8584|nr:uncharacterized protein BX664DRAFT_334285 [Halteromyces radiatus]KAI8089945.1 hypothetical protein BX664DRAFT_334285 [Halteromyces radiatus]